MGFKQNNYLPLFYKLLLYTIIVTIVTIITVVNCCFYNEYC